MTSEPGVLPKDTEELDYQKLPEGFQKMLRQIGRQVRRMENEMREEQSELKR